LRPSAEKIFYSGKSLDFGQHCKLKVISATKKLKRSKRLIERPAEIIFEMELGLKADD
jgi:hypothetical protein